MMILYAVGGSVLLYALVVATLYVSGQRVAAREFAGFIPDCIVLFKHLLQSETLARRYKVAAWLVIGYLALPIDIIPDFIPIAGQFDDAILVALLLRSIIKNAGQQEVTAAWPGTKRSLTLLLKLARVKSKEND